MLSPPGSHEYLQHSSCRRACSLRYAIGKFYSAVSWSQGHWRFLGPRYKPKSLTTLAFTAATLAHQGLVPGAEAPAWPRRKWEVQKPSLTPGLQTQSLCFNKIREIHCCVQGCLQSAVLSVVLSLAAHANSLGSFDKCEVEAHPEQRNQTHGACL